MRIISGSRKGKRLYSTRDENTRPTEDRIKESIFNILNDIEENSYVLDLFAGTGNIGLEFLSRGAKCAVFSDISRSNINCINDNIKTTNFVDSSKVYFGDYNRNLNKIKMDIENKFDYIYLDPPYDNMEIYHNSLNLIKELNLLNEDGIIIVESNDKLDIKDYNIIKEKKYGKKHIYFLNLGE